MNRYAIIMGCDEYKEYNNIPYCNDDVYIMQEALNEYCDYNLNNIEIINLMEKDEDSKIEGLLRKISEFIKKINPEDMLLFYFAGHGIVIENKGYLVLPETEIGKEKTTALSIEALNNLFNEKNINHFNIIDACHSGCDNGQVRGLDFLNIIENQSWATLASCSVNEESYWDNKLEHGVFTYYVVESIEESSTESDITIENLKQMVCEKVKKWCEVNYKNQTPTLIGRITGNISIAKRNKKELNNVEIYKVTSEGNIDMDENLMLSAYEYNKDINLWNPPTGIRLKRKMETNELLECAVELKTTQKRSINLLYELENYEDASMIIFNATMNILRDRVLSLGTEFVGEMVGMDNINYISNLPPFEVINIASELGFIDKTGKVRLSNANELVIHFNKKETTDLMTEEEIKSIIRTCVQYVLAYNDSNLNLEFSDFRNKLKMECIESDSEILKMLVNSPYFYKKTTVRTLLNLLEQTKGAEFETVVSNLIIIIETVWKSLLPDEKYFIGTKYSIYSNEGKDEYIKPLKTALTKVYGFDYVPENLRSLTFIKEAKNIKKVHFGIDNFYKEPNAVRKLDKLGTRIPKPALNECITAVLMVFLGNDYGVSYDAIDICHKIFKKVSKEDWKYYLQYCLYTSEDILYRLTRTNSNVKNWIKIVEEYKLYENEIPNKDIANLLEKSKNNEIKEVKNISKTILDKIVKL